MLGALAVFRQFIGEVAYGTIGAPLIGWPQRFWSNWTPQNRIVRAIFCALPLAALGGLLYLDRFITRVDAVPARMPHHILGMDGPSAYRALHHAYDITLAVMAQLIYVRDGAMHILGQASAEVTVLVLGAVLWVEILLASTLLLGPVHLLMLSHAWQSRVHALGQHLRAPIRRAADVLWFALAERRHVWFAGVDLVNGDPLFVNVDAQRLGWVLGGADRRSNALPFLAQLRAAVHGGGPVLFVDTMDNVGMASDLEGYAMQAGRHKNFQSIRLNEQNATEFKLDAETIQRQGRVVYLGVPTYQKNLDIQEASKRALLTLVELAQANEEESRKPLLVALQDPRDMPEQAMQALTQVVGLRFLFAQQQCDADDLRNVVASLGNHPRHSVLCLSVTRAADASNVAHSLIYAAGRARKDKAPLALSAGPNGQLIQGLKRGEAVAMVNAVIWENVIRLVTSSAKKRAASGDNTAHAP